MPDDTGAPIVAYRWYNVLDDGTLAGARNTVWPPGEALHAAHVSASRPIGRSDGPAPLVSVVWAALRPGERFVAAVGSAELAMGVAAGVGKGAAVAAGVTVGAIWWQVFRRHRDVLDSMLRVFAVLLGLFATAMVATVVWLLILLGISVRSGGPAATRHHHLTMARVGEVTVAAVVCGIMAAALLAMLAMYVRSGHPPRHDCPSKPRRLPHWLPDCGIYAYRTLDLAARDASRGWVATRTVLVARVVLWGRVFPHDDGYRGEWARIEALMDDGGGHVELPAALYRVPVEPLPAGMASSSEARPPRQATAVLAASAAVRAWAERRRTPDR